MSQNIFLSSITDHFIITNLNLMKCIYFSLRCIGLMLLMLASTAGAAKRQLPGDIVRMLSSYNVIWDTPSRSGSLESMPVGNGDITANVWVEDGGDLMMYIGKSDTWSEATRLLKVGRVRVSLSPNPFKNGIFSQELNLINGEILITAGSGADRTTIKVWVDANSPVINVDASSAKPTSMTCVTEIMRPHDVTFTGGGGHPLSASYTGVRDSPVPPSESADVLVPCKDRVEWYHRNTSSMFRTILEKQNVGELADKYADPFINRTFGAAITGKGMIAVNDSTLASERPAKNQNVSIVALTAQTDNVAQWQSRLDDILKTVGSIPAKTAYMRHCSWWDNFWNRSWIFLSGNENARIVTEAYLLQRYMIACQGRGAYPIKFNGGTLTFDYKGKNGDYRNWGPGYWYQNCRLYYWPLTASGDSDMKKAWFDMYMNNLALQSDVTRKYYGHDGAFFPETTNFFGLYIQDDWGWNNTGKASQTRWIRYHYEGALEMLAEMLEEYNHSRDEAFAKNYIVPFATQVISFFANHWPTINDRYRFIPANSLEQYWDCLNPIDYIAGLTHDINELKKLPENIVGSKLREEWDNCLRRLPPLPKTPDGKRLLPAEEYGVDRNFENPECYTIFPFKLYGMGRPDLDVALNTFNHRKFKHSNCWSQCAIQAAILGQSQLMEEALLKNATARDPEVRFPAFWKPGSDYVPDLDNGGVLATAVQHMLIDNLDGAIILLQALPDNWEADFKLRAHDNTVVRAKAKGKTLKELQVTPRSRANDVIIPDNNK